MSSGLGGARLYGDAGADSFTLATASPDKPFAAYDGSDADLVKVTQVEAVVDLGAGNDQLQILNPQSGGDPHLTANVTLTTGTGADAISFVDTLGSANVTATDFDPTQDIRQYYGVHKLSDTDVATGDASGVTLVEGDLTLILQGGTLSELTNAVFVPI